MFYSLPNHMYSGAVSLITVHNLFRYGARYGAQTRAICHTEVKLFDSQWTCDTLFDHFRYQNRIGWGVWRNVSDFLV